MKFNWVRRAAELEKYGTPFAIATVIDTVAPTSAKPMAKAIITSDGKMEGWIGGGCAQNTVIEEGLKCIQKGIASVIRLSPERNTNGEVTYKKVIFLTCESGGTLEFHIEPVLPMTKLAIYGNTPTVKALAKMGLFLDFDVIVLSPDISEIELDQNVTKMAKFSSIEGSCMAVVATQGNGDLHALKTAIDSKPEYLSLIASKKKTKSLLERLKKQEVQTQQIKKIKFPAGLDIGAVTPEEIAVSIMAELVQYRRANARKNEIIINADVDQVSDKEKDPICGMFVDPGGADYFSVYNDVTYYFCCGGCKDRFEEEPNSYVQI